ncbi:hypothetical protein BDR26DRAFT_941358 [Obelidium mucronatum]|nr:hypothetical protein BDR26DRAFT_941358 [Obelidium mucronatum]
MSRIVKKKIQEDVEVLNYFQRNTINFTFAQFDRLRSEVDGVWRLYDQHNPDDVNFARMFRELHKSEVSKEQLSEAMKDAVLQKMAQKHEDLIMTAISVYISHNLRVCLRDAVEKVLGSNQPNLRFNRMVLSRDNTTPAVDRFNAEIKQFFEFHQVYRSAVVSPTGRMILNVRDSSLNVELSENTVITSAESPEHRTFRFPRTFFRANKLSRMLEPVIAARNYGYVQIIDRETIDLDDEDRIFKLLKAKYEEAMALAKTDTASLLVINLSDIVGMITKIEQSVTVATRTEKRQETSTADEVADSKIQSREVENVKNNSREQVLLNAYESSYRQSLLDAEDTINSYENQLEFSNDLVKNSLEKESLVERKQDSKEFTSKTTRNRSTKVSENESFLSRLLKRARKEETTTNATARIESTNMEHVEGSEHERTFREEVTDMDSQKKTAETSSSRTKSRGTDLKHDSVESVTHTEMEFTAMTTHQKELITTNDALTERDTFRLEKYADKSHSEQKQHEQIKSVEHEESEGIRSSTVHEERDENVVGVNKSKTVSDTESLRIDDRTFETQSHARTLSDMTKTEKTRTDSTIHEESKNKDHRTIENKHDSKSIGTDETLTRQTGEKGSTSLKGSTGSSISLEKSTEKGNSIDVKNSNSVETYAKVGLDRVNFVQAAVNATAGIKGTTSVNTNATDSSASNTKSSIKGTESSSLDTDKSKSTNLSTADTKSEKTDKTKTNTTSDIKTDTDKGHYQWIDDKKESGNSHEQTTSKIHEETTRTSFKDTKDTITDTIRDTKSIVDSQTTRESTSQSKETIKENTESRFTESGTLDEEGKRSETRRDVSETITRSEHESTAYEDRRTEAEIASVEHSSKKTAGTSQKYWDSHITTKGVRTEKESRQQSLLSTESAQEQERNKQREVETVENAVKEKEEVLRQMISKDTERLRETSMSEEYRKRLNDIITSRKQLQSQLKKEQEELQKKSREMVIRNTDGSSTTLSTTSQRNKSSTSRDEQSTSTVSETANEVEITQEMLRLKIIDVVGRFAGLSSEYLNNFDLKRGPDVVFAVDNPLLATVVEKTIQWGRLEIIELGVLEHMRIILTPIENNKQIEIECPKLIQKKNNKDGSSIADRLKSLELYGPLSQINRPTLMFSDKMFGMIADADKFCHLTSLTLTGLDIRPIARKESITMSCTTLKNLSLSLCQVGNDGSNDRYVSLSYILSFFSGSSQYLTSVFPNLIAFSFRSPVASLDHTGKPCGAVTWQVTDACIDLMENLQLLDLTKNHIEAESVQRLFGFGVQNDDGERIGFGETLRTLVLDGCTLEGELDSKLAAVERAHGGVLGEPGGKAQGRSVQIL